MVYGQKSSLAHENWHKFADMENRNLTSSSQALKYLSTSVSISTLRRVTSLTASRPRFSPLLQLKQHILATVIVVEEVYVIEHQDKRLSCPLCRSKCYFLELVHDFMTSTITLASLVQSRNVHTSLDIEPRATFIILQSVRAWECDEKISPSRGSLREKRPVCESSLYS